MQIIKQIFNDQQMTTSNSVAQALAIRPDVLTPAIIHLAGSMDKRFPLTYMTEGMKNVKGITGNEYEYRVMVHHRRTSTVAVTASDALGAGYQPFTFVMKDRWLIKDYMVSTRSQRQFRVMSDPVPVQGGYQYTGQIAGNNPAESIPVSDLTEGVQLGQLFAPVGTDFSRGNKSNSQSPGMVRHKLSTIRKSYQMAGRTKNMVADFQFTVKGGKKTNMWMDWEEYQYMLQWLEEWENLMWYGKQSYTEAGQPTMLDENGQPVIIGPGLLEQIIHKDTFSVLTEQKLKNLIGDIYYTMTDCQNKVLTVYTGTGGRRDFDDAMKNYINANEFAKFNDAVFVNSNGQELSLGRYFTQYRHVDGHVLNVVYNPQYDHSAVAQASRKHPVTGFSIESHRMTFVDNSNYDGENNVQAINEKGREMKRWAVAGSEVPKGFGDPTALLRASDIDGMSVHYLRTGGICLKRFDTSIDLRCDAE